MRVLVLSLLAASLSAQIPLPNFVNTYTANATRGFYFQAPTPFVITGLQVPDESGHGLQNVVVYKMTAAPPAFPATSSGGQVFFASGVASNTIIPCALTFSTGDWVGVLGACGDTTTMRNSYATPNFASNVLGNPITLIRFLTQTNLVTTAGNAPYSSEAAFQVSRIKLFVAGQSSGIEYGTGTAVGAVAAPKLITTTPPGIGLTAVFQITNANVTNQGGLIALSLGRANIPFLNGTLLIVPSIPATFSLATPVPVGASTVNVPIPNNTALFSSIPLDFQAFIGVVPDLAMSNGAEWVFGY